MSEPNTRYILAAITPIVEALEQLGVNYHIGGSVASSIRRRLCREQVKL